jgi:hypothetical protein
MQNFLMLACSYYLDFQGYCLSAKMSGASLTASGRVPRTIKIFATKGLSDEQLLIVFFQLLQLFLQNFCRRTPSYNPETIFQKTSGFSPVFGFKTEDFPFLNGD